MITKQELNKILAVAERRELAYDHLTTEERSFVVEAYRSLNPDVTLPEDATEAFFEVLGW